ncbi:MAG: hypothetical protein JOZ33_11510 [Acidobacteriaceae bacterium]|nr:hypothetical protein [Acidobacteriaceae bacterium]
MKRAILLAVAVYLSFGAVAKSAAQVPYNEGSVTRVVLVKILPGHFNAFMDDLKKNIVPIWDSEKSSGLIQDYGMFFNMTSSGPDDWDFGYTLTYKNMAALDGLADKVYGLRMKQYGDKEAEQKVIDKRVDNVRVVSSSLLRDVTLR